MKIDYPDGCEQEWRESLGAWGRETLAALHRQGKHLPDKTDHGSDERWRQIGCKTRNNYGHWRRTSQQDSGAHERILIRKREYGFAVFGLRKSEVVTIDPETGVTTSVKGYRIVWAWYVGDGVSANYEPPGSKNWGLNRVA